MMNLIREKLLNKIGDIQLKQPQEKPEKKEENKKGDSSSNIKADWDNLLEKLSKSNDTTEIGKLLVTFGNKYK